MSTKKHNTSTSDVPLCVDLDGTLLMTDSLVEGIIVLLKRHLYYAFALLGWYTHGRAYLKQKVAEIAKLDPELLPYNKRVLTYLRAEHERGREIFLATASHSIYASCIVEYLGLFRGYFATDQTVNLSGRKKSEVLMQRFGKHKFDYMANSPVDLPIWAVSRHAILVSSNKRLIKRIKQVSASVDILPGHALTLKNYLSAVRVHQWIKNLLIFVPLFASHQFRDIPILIDCVIGFFSFSLCASGLYVMNDLFDVKADRNHPDKCKRMFASGELPLIHGLILCPVLLLCAFILAQLLPVPFSIGLAGYIVITVSYTTMLKTIIAVDVFVLTLLFTYRILMGSIISSIDPSFWLLAFSMFLFLSLALVKRYSELGIMQTVKDGDIEGRGYRKEDGPTILSQGIASGYAATLVLALYINDPGIRTLYVNAYFLWGLCIVLLYWITRLWLKCTRHEVQSDPVLFAMTDPQSLGLGLISVLLLVLASTPNIFV